MKKFISFLIIFIFVFSYKAFSATETCMPDGVGPDPNGGECIVQMVQALSLIQEEGNTLNLEPGVYTLSQTIQIGNDIILVQPSPGNSLIINGLGDESEDVVISADSLNRLFFIDKSGVLDLRNLSMEDGFSSDSGGAIQLKGELIVNNSIFRENESNNGGAIYNSGGSLTINNSMFLLNEASNNGGAIFGFGQTVIENTFFESNSANFGGAIYEGDLLENSTLQIANSEFFANRTENGSGGALFITPQSTVSIISSSFFNNSSMNPSEGIGGGAILNSGILEIESSMISFNSTFVTTSGFDNANGGAIVTNNNLRISDSQFSGNSAGDGFIGSTSGESNGGSIYVINSIPSKNVIIRIQKTLFEDSSSSKDGGAIFAEGEIDMIIDNSTFDDNLALSRGGAIATDDFGPSIILNNCTISNNRAEIEGNGIFNFTSMNEGPSFEIRNSIIAFNQRFNGDDGGAPIPPGFNCVGTIQSEGYNIDNDGSCFDGSVTGDQPNIDPLILQILDNGGNTPTVGLSPNSPAINMGNPVGCVTVNDGEVPLTVDQRGFPRPVGGRCDIGAFELQTIDPIGDTPGDVDGDGVIQNDIDDLILVINAFFGVGSPSGNFDCNGDGDTENDDIPDLVCQINAFFGI